MVAPRSSTDMGAMPRCLYEAEDAPYRRVGLRSSDFGFEILAPSGEGVQRPARLILARPAADG